MVNPKQTNTGRTHFKKGIVPWNKGKTGVYSEEVRTRISNSLKGKKLSPETIAKIKKTKSLKPKKKKITQLEYLKMIPILKIPKERKPISKEVRIKMSLAHKGKSHSPSTQFKVGHKRLHPEEEKNKIRQSLIGHEVKKETREKLSKSVKEYMKNNGNPLLPTIGCNETLILNNLEKTIGYRIARQLCIEGFFVDGYIPELNLVIEVDEEYHNRRKEKDKIREAIIKNKLGCTFLRVNDKSKRRLNKWD